jgi:hypothetical protein
MEKEGRKDGWMDGPWCHCFVFGWVFGCAVLERDFVNCLLFWKQKMKEERKIIERVKSVGLCAVKSTALWGGAKGHLFWERYALPRVLPDIMKCRDKFFLVNYCIRVIYPVVTWRVKSEKKRERKKKCEAFQKNRMFALVSFYALFCDQRITLQFSARQFTLFSRGPVEAAFLKTGKTITPQKKKKS